jgi:hypothetical protein
MINLVDTNDTLQIVLAGAVTTNQAVCYASWTDRVGTPVTDYLPGELDVLSNDTTAVNIVTSPAAGNIRQVKYLNIYNNDTAAMTVTVRFTNNATLRTLLTVVLQVGERIEYTDVNGWSVYTSTGAVKVTAVQSTVEPGYIDGMRMQWVSGTSITVTSGTCYIPSVGANVNFLTSITKAGLVLTPSVFYHLYGYLNSGVPDIEIVTTAPSSPYNGTARTKTGDTTRRYLGSILTDAAGNINSFLHSNNTITYDVNAAGTAQFRVLSNGAATVTTAVSVASCLPVTGTVAVCKVDNTSTNAVMSTGRNGPGGSVFQGSTVAGQRSQWLIGTYVQQVAYTFNIAPSPGGGYIDIIGYEFER